MRCWAILLPTNSTKRFIITAIITLCVIVLLFFAKVVESLKIGNLAMKEHGERYSPDDVDELLSDVADTLAEAKEVSDAISMANEAPEESAELEEELAKLTEIADAEKVAEQRQREIEEARQKEARVRAAKEEEEEDAWATEQELAKRLKALRVAPAANKAVTSFDSDEEAERMLAEL